MHLLPKRYAAGAHPRRVHSPERGLGRLLSRLGQRRVGREAGLLPVLVDLIALLDDALTDLACPHDHVVAQDHRLRGFAEDNGSPCRHQPERLRQTLHHPGRHRVEQQEIAFDQGLVDRVQRAFQREADHLSILAVGALLEDVVSDHHLATVGQIDRPAVVAVQTGDDVVLDDGAPRPALQAVAGTGGREIRLLRKTKVSIVLPM